MTWTDPADPDFSHCEIWYGLDETTGTHFTGPISSTGTSISGLTNGSQYYFLYKTVDLSENVSEGVTGSAVPRPPIPDDAFAIYTFSGNANGTSGNGNHGTVNGPLLINDRFGTASNAYDFNGTSDYIETPGLFNFMHNGGDFTVSFWAAYLGTQSSSSVNTIISNTTESSNNAGVLVLFDDRTGSDNGFGLIVTRAAGGTNYTSNIIDMAVPQDTDWHHFTLLWDNATVTIYVDNQFFDQVPKSNANAPDSGDAYGTLRFGRQHVDGNFYWGSLDDIYIFDRVLSEPEIEGLYSEGLY